MKYRCRGGCLHPPGQFCGSARLRGRAVLAPTRTPKGPLVSRVTPHSVGRCRAATEGPGRVSGPPQAVGIVTLPENRLAHLRPQSLRHGSAVPPPFTQGRLLGGRRGGFYIRPGSFVAALGSAGEQCSPLRKNRMLGVAAGPPPTHRRLGSLCEGAGREAD